MMRSERFWVSGSSFLIAMVAFAGCATKSDVEELQDNVRRTELTEIFRSVLPKVVMQWFSET